MDDSTKGDFPSCLRCHKDKEARERWGCDKELEIPFLEVSCVACSGNDQGCKQCDGIGRVPLKRCPWKIIDEATILVVETCAVHLETGATPNGRGMLNEPATWMDAWHIVSNIRSQNIDKMMKK